MGAAQNKLLLLLRDRPVLAWTLAAADAAESITWIGVLGQPQDWPAFQEILNQYPLQTPVELLQGGATRQESVWRGLQYLASLAGVTHVLIHDGARCLVSPRLLDRCSQALTAVEAVIAAIPVKDTIKILDPEMGTPLPKIASTPDRNRLWAAQTPQGFDLLQLLQAHEYAAQAHWQVTDDAALFENLGRPVYIVEGEETNLKVTTPLDLLFAEILLNSSPLPG
jgi:2-C-methyl-D-erythritol 4-phosphate cytidylyltransferase